MSRHRLVEIPNVAAKSPVFEDITVGESVPSIPTHNNRQYPRHEADVRRRPGLRGILRCAGSRCADNAMSKDQGSMSRQSREALTHDLALSPPRFVRQDGFHHLHPLRESVSRLRRVQAAD